MHQLRIVFTCLCAYLPRKDEVLVVIPDGRNGCPPMPGMPGMPGMPEMPGMKMPSLPPHVPVIEFDPALLSPKSDVKPDLLFRRPGAQHERGLVFLTGSDIKLDPAPSGAPALRGGRATGSNGPASAAEAEDFTWIAGVKELDAAAGVMDPACIASGTSAGDRVVARMSLQGGTLAAQLVATGTEGSPIFFNFADANAPANMLPDRRQALAAGVVYDLSVSSEEMALVLTPFKHGEQRLVFSYAGLPVGSAIEILIKNMPLDSALELTGKINPGVTPDVDAHFAMYYALSATTPKTPWVPFSTRARVGGPICPGARFAE